MANLDADTPWAAKQREKLARLKDKQSSGEAEAAPASKKTKKKAKKKTG